MYSTTGVSTRSRQRSRHSLQVSRRSESSCTRDDSTGCVDGKVKTARSVFRITRASRSGQYRSSRVKKGDKQSLKVSDELTISVYGALTAKWPVTVWVRPATAIT